MPRRKDQLPWLIRNIGVLLTIILMIKVAGYFSITQEKSITQVFKVISRIGMTIVIFLIHRKLIKHGCKPYLESNGLLAPFLYVCYLGLGLASVTWSTDPQYSTLQWLMTFESFVFVILFTIVVINVNHYYPECHVDMVRVFTNAFFPILLTFLIGGFVEPDTFYRGMRGGEEKRLGGWIMNPNELGMLASIGAAMAYILMQSLKKGKWRALIILLVAIVILALTSSRSSAIGFLLIMGILVLQSNNKRMKIIMAIGCIIAVPLALKFVIFKDSGGVEEVLSMTGRLPFWTALLNEGIIKEPFFGYGFMRINYTDYFQGLNTYPGKMTHNTFMQVLMNLGFVGFFIAFWQVVTTVRNFAKAKGHAYRDFFIAMFIPALINSFTEFGVFGEANYGIIFYQFLIMLFVFQFKTRFSKRETVSIRLFEKRHKRKVGFLPEPTS